MELSLKVREIIKQSPNGEPRIILNNKINTNKLSCKSYPSIIHQLILLGLTPQQLTDSFKILEVELIDYLLEFIVERFEKGAL